MLSLLSILPRQINNEITIVLVLAHIDSLNIILPAATGRLPLGGFGTGRRDRIEGVGGGFLAPLVRFNWRGRFTLSATLSALECLFGLHEEHVAAALLLKVLLQDFRGILPRTQRLSARVTTMI